MAALAQPDFIETAIRKELSSVLLPEGITFQRLQFAGDHDGDAAVYVVYNIAEANKSIEERAKDLSVLQHATIGLSGNLVYRLFRM